MNPPPVVVIPGAGSGSSPAATEAEASPRDDAAPRRLPRGDATIAWETDELTARERARRRGLPLLVYVRAGWAAAALEMERAAWADPRVVEAARRFVALKLDVTSAEGDAELYAERYAVERVPATLIFDASGRRVASLTGAASAAALLEAIERADD